MAVLDRVMRNLAVRLSDTFGKAVTVTIQYPGSYDPATRSTSPTTADVAVTGVVGAYDVRQFGDQIQQNDLPLFLPARDIARPQPGDMVTLDGVVMRVVDVRAHYSGAEVALYECQVRQ